MNVMIVKARQQQPTASVDNMPRAMVRQLRVYRIDFSMLEANVYQTLCSA